MVAMSVLLVGEPHLARTHADALEQGCGPMPAIAVIGDGGTTGRPAGTTLPPAPRKPGGSAGLIAGKNDQETQRETIPRRMALLHGRIGRALARCMQIA